MIETFDIAGYCRISVDEELDRDNTSIENQKAIIEDFVKEKFPGSILTFFEDRDRSGYTFEQREGYQEATKDELDALEAKLTYDVKADLLRFRKQVEPYLCDEIVHRYYYQKGGAQQQLIGDPCIERALQVLSNGNEYNNILGK